MSRLTCSMVVCATVVLAANAAQAAAQGSSGNATPLAAAAPTVTLIQTETMPAPGGRAVIVRRATGSPSEIIVLPAQGATAADLASALSLLAQVRAQDDGVLKAPQQRIVLSSAAFAAGQPPETQRFFDNLLNRLAHAPSINVPGIARGRALVIPQNRLTGS
jgi:glucose/arabinose dehydrogenase